VCNIAIARDFGDRMEMLAALEQTTDSLAVRMAALEGMSESELEALRLCDQLVEMGERELCGRMDVRLGVPHCAPYYLLFDRKSHSAAFPATAELADNTRPLALLIHRW
jgi:hypothetical protein